MFNLLKAFTLRVAVTYLTLFPAYCFANDSTAHLITGGIVLEQNNDIVMMSEKLLLSPSKVRVEYEYFNESNTDKKLLVAFALPNLKHLLSDQINGTPLYLDFRTWVDGEQIQLLDCNSDSFLKPFRCWGLGKRSEKLLSDFNAKTAYQKLFQSYGLDYIEPYQLVLREQNFPARKSTQVVHEYTPAVGGGIPYYDYKTTKEALLHIQANGSPRKEDGAWFNCTKVSDALPIVNDWINFMKDIQGTDPLDPDDFWRYLIHYNTLEYILETGKNWKGPIKKFNLEVTADRPFFLNTCFEGLKRTSETSYEFVAENYIPDTNIELLFYFEIDWEKHNIAE